MSKTAPSHTYGTSAYTRPDESSFAPADEAGRFPHSPTNSPGEDWSKIIDQLIDIGRLPDDWDGEGSEAPDPGVLSGATKLALALKANRERPADRVTASVNGTIYFEWHTDLGYQEIEVTSPIDGESRWVARGSSATDVFRFGIPL